MNKVLIITYYWPPSGGAGVQRWLKFSKYLPESGWEPYILTVDPAYAAYPVTDDSLQPEVAHSMKVFKTPALDYFSIYKKDKSKIPSAGFANSTENSFKEKVLRFIRGNFFIPDPRKGWNRYALKKACEIIETEEINHVITTSPPHSTQLIGIKIKKKFPGIKWIADMRDPWIDIYYYNQFYPTFFSKKIDLRLEKAVLQNADRIITIGTSLKKLFSLKVKGVNEKTDIITNGYDENDFSGFTATSPDVFTISYTGTLSVTYPIEGFLESLEKFMKKGNNIRLRFVGTVSPTQRELILAKAGSSNVEFVNYVDHKKAIEYMLSSSALLLIIPNHENNTGIITGKIFEYIASGKPIICLGPVDGDAADMIKMTSSGSSFDYMDISLIEDCIEKYYSKPHLMNQNNISEYSRKTLTQKIVKILETI